MENNRLSQASEQQDVGHPATGRVAGYPGQPSRPATGPRGGSMAGIGGRTARPAVAPRRTDQPDRTGGRTFIRTTRRGLVRGVPIVEPSAAVVASDTPCGSAPRGGRDQPCGRRTARWPPIRPISATNQPCNSMRQRPRNNWMRRSNMCKSAAGRSTGAPPETREPTAAGRHRTEGSPAAVVDRDTATGSAATGRHGLDSRRQPAARCRAWHRSRLPWDRMSCVCSRPWPTSSRWRWPWAMPVRRRPLPRAGSSSRTTRPLLKH